VEGDLDAADPEAAGGADAGVLGHGEVGLDIEDVTLLHVVIGGVEEVGVAEVQLVDLVLAIGHLTQKP